MIAQQAIAQHQQAINQAPTQNENAFDDAAVFTTVQCFPKHVKAAMNYPLTFQAPQALSTHC